MADVRALLKAKRQEARVAHPLASYNQAGQLRCVACGTLVKHASAWEGHLGSKAHRTNVARQKVEEKAREEQRLKELQQQEQVARGKRKMEEQSSDSSDESDDTETKRRKVDAKVRTTGFPADFFSDPSRAPLPPQSDEEDDGEIPEDDASKPPALPAPPAAPPSVIDLEYERFQRELLNGPDFHETYERATLFAEPELVPESTQGLPTQEGENGEQSDLAQKQSEEAARRQKEQDDRELIMDRLLEEERVQEEADMKVTAMKIRLEALKKRREARVLKAQTVP